MIQKKDRKPVIVTTNKRNILSSWWAKSWIKNLERYADFSNRLPRGRTYVRHGAVVHMEIKEGYVYALVQGSRRKPYEVTVMIEPISQKKRELVEQLLQDNVLSMEELLNGEFPKELKEELLDNAYGFFPSRREITVDCSCPDWAIMCKHVIATLYAVALRLDENPLMFFELRGMDPQKFIQKSVEDKIASMIQEGKELKSDRIIEDEDEIQSLFDL